MGRIAPSRRAAAALLAALLTGGPLGCVAFPAYPGEREARLFDDLPRRGGVVRVDASFELIGNGRWMASRPSQRQKYVAPIASAYRLSGVFDRVAERARSPT